MATVVPQIDFYMGRTVEHLGYEKGVGDNADDKAWYIGFEGGAHIYVMSGEMPVAETLVGKKLSMQVLDNSLLKLYFGTDENPTGTVVHIPSTGYEISDPDYQDGKRINPNQPPELAPAELEPSAPGDRVAEGPEESQEAVSGDETAEGHQVLDSAADDE